MRAPGLQEGGFARDVGRVPSPGAGWQTHNENCCMRVDQGGGAAQAGVPLDVEQATQARGRWWCSTRSCTTSMWNFSKLRIDANQLGRRNLRIDQFDYLLGRLYNRKKKAAHGNSGGKNQHSELESQSDTQALHTAATLGLEHGVSRATVIRAGKRAEALDKLAARNAPRCPSMRHRCAVAEWTCQGTKTRQPGTSARCRALAVARCHHLPAQVFAAPLPTPLACQCLRCSCRKRVAVGLPVLPVGRVPPRGVRAMAVSETCVSVNVDRHFLAF